jgi:hypothetical protein
MMAVIGEDERGVLVRSTNDGNGLDPVDDPHFTVGSCWHP